MIIEPFRFTDFSGDARYGDAVGRVRVLEQRLVSPRRCARAAAARDLHAAVDELRGTDYEEPLSRLKLPGQLRAGLDEVGDRRLALARHLGVPAELLGLVDTWRSVQRLKRRVRSGLVSDGAADPVRPPLTAPDGAPPALPSTSRLATAIRAAEADFERHHSVARLDLLLERSFALQLRETVDATAIPFLERLVRHYLDVKALASVLRWRAWLDRAAAPDVRPPRVDPELLPVGGYLRPDDLAALSVEAWERMGAALDHTPYGPMLGEGAEHYLGTGDLWLFEKRGDDFLTAYCRVTRYTAFGVEPIVAYGWFLRQETRNVRLVLGARAAGIAAGAVISRLREGYDV